MNHDTSISWAVVCDWSLPEDNYSLYSLAFLQWFPAPWKLGLAESIYHCITTVLFPHSLSIYIDPGLEAAENESQ